MSEYPYSSDTIFVSTERIMDTMVVSVAGDGGPVRRRRIVRSEQEKRRILAEASEPGVSVAAVARRHGLNANLLFTWRRQFAGTAEGREALPRLVPASVVDANQDGPPETDRRQTLAGVIEIDLGDGRVVRFDQNVSAAALRRVLDVLTAR
jgi:transposase